MSITVPTNFSTGSFLNASQPLEYNSSTNTLYLNNAISNIVSTLTGATNNTLCTSLGTKTYVDNLFQGIVWVNPIKNFWNFSTPPSSPSVGDAYISNTTTGTYLLNYIYTWNGTVWFASKPDLYWTMYNESNNESNPTNKSRQWRYSAFYNSMNKNILTKSYKQITNTI